VRHQPPGPPVDPGPAAETAAIADGTPEAGVRRPDDPADPPDAEVPGERGLRGLIGGGSSQVSPASAMRARDAARPRPEDLARAETELVIVRRRWVPRDPPPG
jgi:hypothetical protein